MKRIIDMREADKAFAVWCTVKNRFDTVSDNQAWFNITSFVEDCASDPEASDVYRDRVVGLLRSFR
jgi:hypothetical protein